MEEANAALANLVQSAGKPKLDDKKTKPRLSRTEDRKVMIDVARGVKQEKEEKRELQNLRRTVKEDKQANQQKELQDKTCHRRRITKLVHLIKKYGIDEREVVSTELPGVNMTLEALQMRHAELSDILARADINENTKQMIVQTGSSIEAAARMHPDLPDLNGLTRTLDKDEQLAIAVEEWSIEHDNLFAMGPSFRILYCFGKAVYMTAQANQQASFGAKSVPSNVQAVLKDL